MRETLYINDIRVYVKPASSIRPVDKNMVVRGILAVASSCIWRFKMLLERHVQSRVRAAATLDVPLSHNAVEMTHGEPVVLWAVALAR